MGFINNKTKALLIMAIGASVFTLNGCSSQQPDYYSTKKVQDYIEQSNDNNLSDLDTRVKKKQNHGFVSLGTEKKLLDVVNRLSIIDGNFYSLEGDDIKLPAVKNYKVSNLVELQEYVSNMTPYHLETTSNPFLKQKVVKLTLSVKDESINEIFNKTIYDAHRVLVPADVFRSLPSMTGYNISVSEELKQAYNNETYLNFNGSLKEFLEHFAFTNNYFLNVDHVAKKIVFEKYKNKIFFLKVGSEKYDTVSDVSIASSSSMATTTSATQADGGTSTTGTKISSSISFQEELAKQLELILNDKTNDSFSLNPINSMLYVRTNAKKMKAIEDYVNKINTDFSKQIVTTITVYGVTLNKEHQYGIDWSYVTDATGSATRMLGTASEVYSPTSALSEGSVFKLGSDSGMGALVKAISKFGTTSSVHKDTLILANNHPMVHSLGNTQSYISKVTYVSSTSITSGAMMEREQAEVYDGLYLFFKPMVMEDDTVKMTIRLSMSKVNDIVKQEFSDGTYVQSPDVNKINLNHYATLRSGDRLVIGGILAKEDTKKYTGLLPLDDGGAVTEAIAPLAGQKESAESTVEYIVVVEAHIQEM